MSDEITIQELLEWPELADVKAELTDPRFATRTHGSRATYALKCRGPLCKHAEKVRGRRRYRAKAFIEGRDVQTYLRRYNRDALLDWITDWHKKDIALRRLEEHRNAG